jgi:lipopolysaccharide transport system permease protein
MTRTLLELAGAHNLLLEWTARTLRARYHQSVLGWLWAVIQPLAQAGVLAVVFTAVVPVRSGPTPYFLFVFAATSVWAFLASSLVDMSSAVVDNVTLVNKVRFVRAALPLGTMLARLVDCGITLALVVALAMWSGVWRPGPSIVAVPAVIAVQMALVGGLGLAAAAANVFVRDVRSLLQLGLQLWFYASPVLYPVEQVPQWAQPYYALNPMVGILDAYRAVLLRAAWPGPDFLLAAIVSICVGLGGLALFASLEPRFADAL